jgi:phage/plasmid-like protein (TIGR03299 family)
MAAGLCRRQRVDVFETKLTKLSFVRFVQGYYVRGWQVLATTNHQPEEKTEMAHEIENTDSLVLGSGKKAWHGMGRVVHETMDPLKALKYAGLEWEIDQRPMFTHVLEMNPETGKLEDKYVPVPNHVANYRSDTQEMMGIVRENYHVVNNRDAAEFAIALGGTNEVQVETAGSLQGGRKVWFLLKGDAFEVGGPDDVVYKYILLSNGHDGKAPFRVTPTTIRVVCSNTMHAVVPRFGEELAQSAYMVRHTSSMMDKLEEVREALKTYNRDNTELQQRATRLAKAQGDTEAYKAFFWEAYQEAYSEIPMNPQTKVEERRKERALDAYKSFTKRFDDEKAVSGTGYWTALNAWTGVVQHDAKARGKDDMDRIEKRVQSNLFGLNANRTLAALNTACKLAGV